MTKKKKTVLSVLGALFAILLVAGWFVGRKVYDRKASNIGRSAELFVYPDATWESVTNYIIDSCDVRWNASLRRCIDEVSADSPLKPGHYKVEAGQTSTAVARMLSHGWQTPVKLVLSGTMRLQSGIAKKISAQMMLDSADVIMGLRDSALLAGLGFTKANVFSLFIPDTYEVLWTESMPEILARQKKAYDAFWSDENKKKAETQGLTQAEVAILASIVKGETNYEPEMPKIAGAYLNRLRKGMKLQADPTIAYCYNYTLNRILKKHLSVDSPFNTYLHKGLPPAPICVPTKACLEAVLNPDTADGYIYFCANSNFDGTHSFASSYTEHLKNARSFQRALTVKQKEAKAAKASAK
ncbi:MAG: endolytic transglycosylase MltG [Bacteroidales bacterium]|nr:endolytic transglycosylase MltG [Bacteroidales bacterium]